MANELAVSSSVVGQFADGGNMVSPSAEFNITLVTTSQKRIRNKQALSSSAEALVLGEVAATNGLVGWWRNCSVTAGEYIDIKNGSGGATLVRLNPGETWPVRLVASVVPYAASATGTPSIEYEFVEG